MTNVFEVVCGEFRFVAIGEEVEDIWPKHQCFEDRWTVVCAGIGDNGIDFLSGDLAVDFGGEVEWLFGLSAKFESPSGFVVEDDSELLIGLKESEAGFELAFGLSESGAIHTAAGVDHVYKGAPDSDDIHEGCFTRSAIATGFTSSPGICGLNGGA